MTKKRYAINGKFLTQRLTGVQRYAKELVLALDRIVPQGMFMLACPHDKILNDLSLKNIEIIALGTKTGVMWEQTEFPSYAKRVNRTPLNLCNAAPLSYPGVVCVHDLLFRNFAEAYSSFYKLWYRTLFRRYEQKGEKFFATSYFTVSEVKKIYPKIADKMTVVAPGWQHMTEINVADVSSLVSLGLQEKGFLLAVASRAKYKNFSWITKLAQYNPEEIFVFAGDVNGRVYKDDATTLLPNVIELGYVSDAILALLMKSCKAFLFPSLYEGFGMPPLEALSLGARIVISDIPVFREVYGDSAIYINPEDPNIRIKTLLSETHEETANNILQKYSWKSSAINLLEYLSE